MEAVLNGRQVLISGGDATSLVSVVAGLRLSKRNVITSELVTNAKLRVLHFVHFVATCLL